MKRRKNRLLRLAVCAFAVYILSTLVYETVQIRRSSEQLAQLHTQLQAQQQKNAETQRMLNETDEQLMENVARNDLGYAKPNERIFMDASGN